MITEIDASLLEKIADLTGKPVGAFNIRKDSLLPVDQQILGTGLCKGNICFKE